MLNIAYIGNFHPPHSTENHVARSFESLGHRVLRLQESEISPSDIVPAVLANSIDMLLYTRTWGLNGPETLNVWKQLEDIQVPTASYHLDLYYGLARSGLYGDLASKQITCIGDDPFWRVKYCFTVDGDPEAQAYFDSIGLNHIYLRAGVVHDEVYIAPQTEWKHDVIFVGSGDYGHPEWPYRAKLIEWLRSVYGNRFGKYGSPENSIRGSELNDLYANCKVVVGDSLTPGFSKPGYWSDRIYETLGRGGFMIYPYTKGLEKEFQDGQHVAFYTFDDFVDLHSKIEYYLDDANAPERERIRQVGNDFVANNCTYRHRLSSMLDHMAAHEPKLAAKL